MHDKDGYIIISTRNHPYPAGRKWIGAHVAVMERIIHRPIRRGVECVHHRDGDKTNNKAGNLMLIKDKIHKSINASRQSRDAKGRFE